MPVSSNVPHLASRRAGILACARPFQVALLLLFLTSCGYVGPILPPSPQIPAGIKDLTAVQRGGKIEIAFHTPPRTTDNVAIEQFSNIELRIGPALSPFNVDDWLATSKPIALEPPESGDPLDPRPIPLSASIPIEAFVGKHVAIAVRTAIKRDSHYSVWSNRVELDIAEPLATPLDLKASASAEGVVLQWQPVKSAEGYKILRQDTGAAKPVEIGTSAETHFVDTTTQFDTAYSYSVVAFTGKETESAMSAIVTITPVDTFPPAVPSAVTILPGPDSIELSWQRSPEADTAGYLIYRSVNQGPFEKVGDIVPLPTFSDRAIEHGKTYRYQISSIDKKNNESAKSDPVEVPF